MTMHISYSTSSVNIARFATNHDLAASYSAAVKWGVLATILIIGSSCSAFAQNSEPSSEFTPGQVVRIVVESLKNNDQETDNGIETVFRFASPVNKLNTGPLARFTSMIKKGYPDMLNHVGARYDLMKISGSTAIQAVWLMTPSGKEVGYAFQLSQQTDGEYIGAWMTDSVISLGEGSGSGTRI